MSTRSIAFDCGVAFTETPEGLSVLTTGPLGDSLHTNPMSHDEVQELLGFIQDTRDSQQQVAEVCEPIIGLEESTTSDSRQVLILESLLLLLSHVPREHLGHDGLRELLCIRQAISSAMTCVAGAVAWALFRMPPRCRLRCAAFVFGTDRWGRDSHSSSC